MFFIKSTMLLQIWICYFWNDSPFVIRKTNLTLVKWNSLVWSVPMQWQQHEALWCVCVVYWCKRLIFTAVNIQLGLAYISRKQYGTGYWHLLASPAVRTRCKRHKRFISFGSVHLWESRNYHEIHIMKQLWLYIIDWTRFVMKPFSTGEHVAFSAVK